MDEVQDAPGGPGTPPTWSSSDKDMVTTALGPSRVWATLGHGIVNEVYWPSTGRPQIRDLGFIVAGPNGWTEVKRTERYLLSLPRPYVPLPSVVHEGDDFRLELEFLPHPLRDVLLIRFALSGEGMKLHALVAPHLNGMPTNSGFAGADLMASEGEAALCLYADTGFSRTSAGYVGTSDGWQDFARNGRMTWQYPAARNGNIALMGELAASNGILALGFSQTPEGARTLARSALADDYNETRTLFVSGWENWGRTLKLPYASPETRHAAELSAMVIKVHEDRTYAGAVVASLSVPWGRAMTMPAAIIWCGPATRWRLRSRSSLRASMRMPAARSIISSERRRRKAIGHRTITRTDAATGPASSSMKWPCRCCWPPSCGPWGISPTRRPKWPWCAQRSTSSCVMAR
ncbi:hypothetical protein [Paradevosia shaoguanensis]|uniref:hypothetical protein n=1 Tax=Paradevosia shaoguanensis TaxID=1335043 RepID=UPI001FE3AB8B|nr:hypothetical protein [Paradevosia shaoguanensis]